MHGSVAKYTKQRFAAVLTLLTSLQTFPPNLLNSTGGKGRYSIAYKKKEQICS